MATLGEKIWAGRYDGPDGAITELKREIRVMSKQEFGERMVSIASSFYSSATNSLKLVKNGNFFLLPRSVKRLFTARRLALRALERDALSADECDVLQSIFRLTSRIPFFGDDLNLAGRALSRASACDQEPHTKALLAMGTLDVMMRGGFAERDDVRIQYKRCVEAYEEVLKLLNAADLPAMIDTSVSKETIQLGRQASRIARHLSAFARRMGQDKRAQELRDSAHLLACQFGSQDQMHKAS